MLHEWGNTMHRHLQKRARLNRKAYYEEGKLKFDQNYPE
jgi:hypothetical protein